MVPFQKFSNATPAMSPLFLVAPRPSNRAGIEEDTRHARILSRQWPRPDTDTYRPAHHLTHLAKPADAAPMVAPFRPPINAPTNIPTPAALAMFNVSCFQLRCGLIQGRTWDAFI